MEDQLLRNTDWRNDGYRLFDISTLAESSAPGYFSPISESNFCTLRKTTFEQECGFEIRFTAPGGGSANLDSYKRISEKPEVQTIHLPGEGTFHQFHGGVASNVPLSEHPGDYNRAQYESIRGKKFTIPNIQPIYFGTMPEQAKPFISRPN